MEAENGDHSDQLIQLELMARQGIQCAAEAKCNATQCQVLSTVFYRLLILALRWRLCFPGEFDPPEVRKLVRALVATVDSASQLVGQYANENWLTTVIFNLDNELGFSDAADNINRHVMAIWRNIQGSQKNMEAEQVEATCTKELLQKACIRDREDLKVKSQQEYQGMSIISMIRSSRFRPSPSRFKTSPLTVLKAKLDGYIQDIPPTDIQKGGRLGEGAFGQAFKAIWLGKIPVAIKEAKPHDLWLRKELEIMKKLCHPNVVQVLGRTEHGIVMELMEMNLGKFLRDTGKPGLLHGLDMILQIAKGMCFLHEKGVCYRDLKPENILILKGGKHLKLADFGHSKSHFNSLQDDHTGRAGTVIYMAPEVLRLQDVGQYDKKADVFSFACCCSEILTGQQNSRIELYRLEAGERPPLPEDIPPKLTNLVQACWMFQAVDRPDFKTILDVLWEIREGIITGKTAGRNANGLSPQPVQALPLQRSEDSSIFGSVPGSISSEPSSTLTPTRITNIQELTIQGDKVIGSKLTAKWTHGNDTNSCVVQWMRCGNDIPSIPVGEAQQVFGTSSEYVITPDDLDFVIGIRCMSVAKGLQNGADILCSRCDAPVSRGSRLNDEFNRLVRDHFAEFSVRIDKQRLPGSKLVLERNRYQLWWHMSSRKNFRVNYDEGGVFLGDNPVACTLKNHTGQEYTLKFVDTRRRDLAVLLWRYFSHEQQTVNV